MKINICNNPSDIRVGYINISSATLKDPKYGTTTTVWDMRNLTGVVDAGGATEIFSNHTLQGLRYEELPAVFANWKTLLAPDGKVIIKSIDLEMIGNDIAFDRLAPDKANALLFGIENKGCHTVGTVSQALIQSGFTIVSKTIKGHEFMVEATIDATAK